MRRNNTTHIRVIHDPAGETLTVNWEESRTELICGETGEGVFLIKDRSSQNAIGFEKLNYPPG